MAEVRLWVATEEVLEVGPRMHHTGARRYRPATDAEVLREAAAILKRFHLTDANACASWADHIEAATKGEKP